MQGSTPLYICMYKLEKSHIITKGKSRVESRFQTITYLDFGLQVYCILYSYRSTYYEVFSAI